MKLTNKIISAVFLIIIIVLALDGYLSVRREIELFDNDMKRDAFVLGHAMKKLVSHTWEVSGKKRALELIKDTNEGEKQIRVRWVWVEAQPSDPFGPRVSRLKLGPVTRGQEISFKKEGGKGSGYRFTYVPVPVDNKKRGALELSESLYELEAYTRETITRTIALGIVLLVVCWLVLRVVGGNIIGFRLDQLAKKVHSIIKGNFSADLEVRGRDEITELEAGLNRMCEQFSASQEGRQDKGGDST